MTVHLRYKAVADEWDFDLKLEGFNEETQAYWSSVLQKEMIVFLKLYPKMKFPYKILETG